MLATSPDREFGDGHADEEQQDGRLGVGPASDVEPLVASWGTTTPNGGWDAWLTAQLAEPGWGEDHGCRRRWSRPKPI
jgi:hypothetical protein